jgi:Arc/MetJ-type ribon-helix-helix transcriptional regulator
VEKWNLVRFPQYHALPSQKPRGMIICHTLKEETVMSQTKVAITIEAGVLARVDALVRRNVFRNRSRAIQEAVLEKLERLERNRLAEECAKLDPAFEKAMADEGLANELDAWPRY